MPLKASVGLSKKLGLPDYGSIGAHCQLEVELDVHLIEDAEAFQEKIRRLYLLAHQSITDQLARYGHPAGVNAEGPHNGTSGGNGRPLTPPAVEPDQDAPASNKQIKYLLDLARQQHDMNMPQTGEYCASLVGVRDVYQLTRSQASRVIDALSGNGHSRNGQGTNYGRSRVNGRR